MIFNIYQNLILGCSGSKKKSKNEINLIDPKQMEILMKPLKYCYKDVDIKIKNKLKISNC